eukprot:c5855_g1_i1.p1 GENE.c5855_g1_i1~~c5855_g1_i1.p1  ORF type:complete len:137 (+),score=39.05 c5855_g1_i1:1-411(+)
MGDDDENTVDAQDADETGAEKDDGEDEVDPDMIDSFIVKIDKAGTQESFTLYCAVQNGDYHIVQSELSTPKGKVEHQFSDSVSAGYEVEVEEGLLDYLVERGISQELVAAMNSAALHQIHGNYVHWLKAVSQFTKK